MAEFTSRLAILADVPAQSAIFDYVEAFSNPRRRHSSISNLSPAEFESRHMADADAA